MILCANKNGIKTLENAVAWKNPKQRHFLFPFLPLADIAFEEFRFFKDMYKLPEFHIRQLVIIDTQPLAVKRSLLFNSPKIQQNQAFEKKYRIYKEL